MRLFVAAAFIATLFVTGPAAAHFAKSLEASSPLQLIQDKDKGNKKKKKSTKDTGSKTAPQKAGETPRYGG